MSTDTAKLLLKTAKENIRRINKAIAASKSSEETANLARELTIAHRQKKEAQKYV